MKITLVLTADRVPPLQSTPSEILLGTPIGPFIILSAISIWRNGLAAWNIPPCKEYLALCESIPSIQFGS